MNGIDSPSVKNAIVIRVTLGRPVVLVSSGWFRGDGGLLDHDGFALGRDWLADWT